MTPSNPERGSRDPGNALRMAPEEMLALAHETTELLVRRIASLPAERAWEGEFKQGLDRLMEEPPEHGLPGVEVLEKAASEILPLALRLDHPRCFGFIPSSPTWPGVLADFLVSGYSANVCTWLVASGPSQVELAVIDRLNWPSSNGSATGLAIPGVRAES